MLAVNVCHYSGVWGTVCDDSFSDTDARVVCRQLGYSTTNARARADAYYGPGSGTIWLSNVGCSGTESGLTYCYNPGWGVEVCTHSEDVGVSCSKLAYNCRFCMVSLY